MRLPIDTVTVQFMSDGLPEPVLYFEKRELFVNHGWDDNTTRRRPKSWHLSTIRHSSRSNPSGLFRTIRSTSRTGTSNSLHKTWGNPSAFFGYGPWTMDRQSAYRGQSITRDSTSWKVQVEMLTMWCWYVSTVAHVRRSTKTPLTRNQHRSPLLKRSRSS